MKITRLQTNHLTCPLGFDLTRARLSWTVEDARGSFAAQVRIQMASAPEETALLTDTGLMATTHDPDTGCVLDGPDNLGWPLPMELAPRTRYYWRVWVQDDAGDAAWSDWTWLETAKAPGERWDAQVLASPFGPAVHPVFHHTFRAEKPLRQARLYCLGLGEYEAYLNGEKLGDEVLLPGFHAYDSYLQYQTFAPPVHPGENTLAFLLGDGWYKGRYGLKQSAPRYGEDYALLAELHLCYEDGTEEVIGTDESWLVTPGPVTFDGIYDGETFDARLMGQGESRPAIPSPLSVQRLTPRISPCLRVQEERRAQRVPGAEQIFDMGQNMAGWVSFVCDAPAGTIVTLRFAEMLRDGTLYRDNLRGAKCTFTYISDGRRRVVRPHFTYFGFRYVSVEGYTLAQEDITGCVIYSDMRQTGFLRTAHEKLNRLFDNVLWSQKGNFLDVPTDCPQRDERMGWTGDIQVFSDAACFNMDCTAFLTKYMHDLLADQRTLGGNVPCVSPMTAYHLGGVAAWGDAVTVVPWFVYLHSGDAEILRLSLPGMLDWVDWIHAQTEQDGTGDLWTASPQLGDWLALDGRSVHGGTDRGLIATAYYFDSAVLTAKAARTVGDTANAQRMEELSERIRRAFLTEYFTPSGRIAVPTQTACVLARYLNLIPPGAESRVDDTLRCLLEEAGMRLETGFVGTPWLLPVLSMGGRTDWAYTLLLREEYPSWLYEVNLGATTIWERWNSIEPDGSMNRDGMNSFNHYAYGSVAAWMYRVIGGLSPDEDAPGFRCIRCAPEPDRRLPWAETRLDTGHGLCRVYWQWHGDEVALSVQVPFGCVMRLTLPFTGEDVRLTAGTYQWTLTAPPAPALGLDTPWRELLGQPETRAAVEANFPRAIRGIAFQQQLYTMRHLLQSPFAELTREEAARLEAAIRDAQHHMLKP
ncbi:MAG: family 78 glycoside hydrolase catalytic domain [Aristaeellaceae bacterium]